MTTYTTTADSSGNWAINFGMSYAGGQAATVQASSGGNTKTINLNAPSSVINVNNGISWSGTMVDFPLNVGVITLGTDINGAIADNGFYSAMVGASFGGAATGLVIKAATRIGQYSFYGWALATSLVLPTTLTYIDQAAFNSWGSLTSLTIPNSVVTIADSAFQNISACTTLTLGTGVKTIGQYAFANLASIVSITSLATTPPAIQPSTFDSMPSTVKIYVPSASLSAYKAATNWKAYASKMIGI